MITYTPKQADYIQKKRKEAENQFNQSKTVTRRAIEEREEAKRLLAEMGL